MPCYDSRDHDPAFIHRDCADKAEVAFLTAAVHTLEAVACGTIRALKSTAPIDKQWYDLIDWEQVGFKKELAIAWFEQHEKEDEIRYAAKIINPV